MPGLCATRELEQQRWGSHKRHKQQLRNAIWAMLGDILAANARHAYEQRDMLMEQLALLTDATWYHPHLSVGERRKVGSGVGREPPRNLATFPE